MKVINSDTGFLAYQKIFSSLMANQIKLMVWQYVPDTGKRNVTEIRISAFNLESKSIHVECKKEFPIDAAQLMYFYSEEAQLIFKTNLQEMRDNNFSVNIPEEIKLLDEPDFEEAYTHVKSGLEKSEWRVKRIGFGYNELGTDVMRVKSMSQRSSRDQDFLNQEFHPVNLDEEEKMFASKREAPRARPKANKKVKILVKDEAKVYKLFDLSQGGMGFLTDSFEDFDTGSQVRVIGFDDFNLDDPLIGTIKNVRPLEGAQVEFKVGVKFDEGQS